uniref:CPSF_A domain-containing protein n=1 Tax=Steinernema glaseri TaxID=37863 RepID=A0A1I7Y4T9_9BILA
MKARIYGIGGIGRIPMMAMVPAPNYSWNLEKGSAKKDPRRGDPPFQLHFYLYNPEASYVSSDPFVPETSSSGYPLLVEHLRDQGSDFALVAVTAVQLHFYLYNPEAPHVPSDPFVPESSSSDHPLLVEHLRDQDSDFVSVVVTGGIYWILLKFNQRDLILLGLERFSCNDHPTRCYGLQNASCISPLSPLVSIFGWT